jgi:polyhydroxyalkanoate synthase
MFSGETVELLKKISESHIEMTTNFLNSSLDNLNKANPALFKSERVEELKNKISKSTALSQDSMQLFTEYVRLCQYTMAKSIGMEAEPIVAPDRSDRRFSDENWNENIAFDYIKQFYLLSSRYILNLSLENEHIDKKHEKQIEFYAKQFTDALSPNNFAATNPVVLKQTIENFH